MSNCILKTVCVLALFGLATPAEAGAQGWLEKVKEARRRLLEAQAAKDSAAATLRGMRGAKQAGDSGSVAAGGADGEATSSAGGEVARSSGAGGRRRPGCMTHNTYQCAAAAALGETVDGAIGGNNAEVFYRFRVDQPGVYRLALDPMPNNQAVTLNIADAQYTQIATFQHAAGQPGTRLLQMAAPGMYYAHLRGNSYQTAQPFSFTVVRNSRSRPAPTPAPEPADGEACSLNNTFQCAEDARVGERIAGALGGSNAHRLFYRFELEQPGTMEFRLNPMPNRAGVELIVTDDQYHQIGRIRYPAGQPKGQLLRLAAPGTYFMHLSTPGGTAERFALMVTAQP